MKFGSTMKYLRHYGRWNTRVAAQTVTLRRYAAAAEPEQPIIMTEIIWRKNLGACIMDVRGFNMENLDGALLNAVQTAYPIQSDPYATLADLVGTNANEAFERMENMRQNGIIRRLGGVFDSRRLG